MKHTIRLRESELKRMIAESVRKVINEEGYTLPNGSNVKNGRVTTPSGRKFNTNKPGKSFNLDKNCEVLPNGTKVCDNGEVTTKNGRNFNLQKEAINRIVYESVRKMLKESAIPQYENPVFLECTSEEDADVCVELGYSDYSSSRFYVGGCGTDAYAALAVIVEYLVENGIIDRYAYDEEDLEAYDVDDFVEIEGYYLPSWLIHIEQIVGNHGERPDSLSESIRRNVRSVLREIIK